MPAATGTTGGPCQPEAVRPRARAIAVVFAANGLGGASFLARLPERQSDLGLSDAGLGLALVGFSLGALVVSPLAGRLVGVVGSRPLVVAATVALGGCLWLVGAAPSAVALFAALAAVGAADAAMDIAINANGAAYEGRTARSVMHRLHGAWSVGALAAASAAGLAAAVGVPLTVHLAGVGLVLVAATLVSRPRLVAGDGRARRPGGAVPAPAGPHPPPNTEPDGRTVAGRGDRDGRDRRRRRLPWPLLVLGAATVGGAVIEGGPVDWSAVLLERYGASEGVAALGVAAFLAGMLAGRIFGDWATDRLGGGRVLRLGTSLVAGGIALGALAGHPVAFTAGLVVAGVGAAGFFPLAFSAAARMPGVSPGAGAATVSLAARIGFLAEPVLMGAVAELTDLRWAFGLVAVTALVLAAAASRIVPPAARPVAAPTADPRTP